MDHRFSLGIDLGTSNSALAISEVENDRTEMLEITQALGPNRIGDKPTLPSALYIPHPDEFAEGAFPLPWRTADRGDAIIGHFARDHGALVPDRLITSAKSWLSNPHIDPRQGVLPWKSNIREKKAVRVRLLAQLSGAYKGKFLLLGAEPGQGHGTVGCAGGPDGPSILR
jgi:molecular chaperone DnaK (HSP70)